MSSWGRVFRSLRDRMPPGSYHLGKSLLRVEQDASSVSAIFADGTHERGDLLIGADGGRSTVRELFLPGQQPDYAGYVAWRAMLDERDVPPAIHEELFVNFTYCLPPGELFLAYPVPGRNNETQPGQRGLQHRLVPANHASTARRFLHRCEREAARHVDPAAPAATRDHRMDQDAGPRAGGSSGRGDFRARPAAVFQAILDFTSPQIVFGRVALLGDAAFLARPHPGAGTTKCAMDAECLADSIASLGIDGALRNISACKVHSAQV